MIPQRNLRLALVVSSMSVFLMTVQSAQAQFKFQRADGHQTVAPSDMPQQPSMSEEFTTKSNMMNNSTPQSSLDLPGTPGVVNSAPNVQTPIGKIQDNQQARQANNTGGSSSQLPQSHATTPGQAPTPGSLVYPNGMSSATRIGPVEPTSMWTRFALAAFLMIQFAAMTIVAIVLQRKTTRHEIEYQGGHIIDEGHKEEWVHRHQPRAEL